jgi:hypothetical protein
MIWERLADPEIIKVNGISAFLAGVAIYAMARASGRGALNWKRALAVFLLVSLAIFAASASVLYARGGPYRVMHGGPGMVDFIVFVIIQVLLALPAWLVVGSIAAVILGFRSAKIAHANGTSA